MLWLEIGDENADTKDQVLRGYFSGSPLPANASALLLQSKTERWLHPDTGHPLPTCAKAVVLEDVLRKEQPQVKRKEVPIHTEMHCISSHILMCLTIT